MKVKKMRIHENQLSLFDERMKVQSTLPPLTIKDLLSQRNMAWVKQKGAYSSDQTIVKLCQCGEVYRISEDLQRSSQRFLERNCQCEIEPELNHRETRRLTMDRQTILKALHIYPESETVIRFSFQSRSLYLQGCSLLKDCQRELNQSLEEVAYLRYHLDGTIEQSNLNLISEDWYVDDAMSHLKADVQKITCATVNTKYQRHNQRSWGSYVEDNLKQCCYFDYDYQLEHYYFDTPQQTSFSVYIDETIQTLKHPVAQRHPYFYVMNQRTEQSLGYFAQAFLGCHEMLKRFPQMEQVIKSGYQTLSKEWVHEFAKQPTKKFQLQRMFKPGQNLSEIIGLPKPLLRLLREEDINYKTYQLVLKVHQVSPLHEESLRILLESRHEIDFNRFWRNIREKRAESMELLMYLRSCWNQQGIPMDEALILWDDYLSMAIETNVPFKKFPPMLKMSHDVLARDVKKIRDVKEQAMFQERATSLEYLTFEDAETGYGIYVPQTCNDLVIEGRTLHHCVGSYQRRFAKGETTILFIRRLEEPDKPLYTLEWDLKKQKILQLKGNSNSNVTNREALACLRKWQERQASA